MIRRLGFFTMFLFLLITACSVQTKAQVRFNIFAPETKAYPQVRTFFQTLDKDDAPLAGLDSNDFDVFENGIRIPNSALIKRCSSIVDGPALSVVLVIDKSGSMSEQVGQTPDDTRFKFVKIASKLFVQQLNFIDPTAVAIVSFDGQSYLEQDWTNNRNQLLAAIDKIELGTATAYDPPLLHKQWGAIKLLSERPTEPVKRVIIFLTDGEPNRKPTVDSIRKGLQDNGIVFYAITAFTGMNADLARFASETGGESFEANSRDAAAQLQDIYAKIATKLQAKEVCYLQWKSPMGCDDSSRKRKIDITLKKGYNITKSSEYLAPASSILRFDVSPPILSFGNPLPNTPITSSVTVTAKTGQVTLTKGKVTSPAGATFKLTDWDGSTPITIDSGKSRTFAVEFTQGNVLDFRQGTLELTGTPCSPPILPLVGGTASVILVDPISSEVRSTCNDLTILWAGVDSAQEVIIQYSSDDGATWNLLANNATGLKYIWSADELKKLDTKGKFRIKVGLPSAKTYVWAKQIGGTLSDSSVSISLSSDGLNAFVGGSFVGVGTFDTNQMSSAGGSRDGFYAQIDVSGNVVYVKGIGGTSEDQITGIAAGPGKVAYTTGWYIGDATFGNQPGLQGAISKTKASDKSKRNFFMARIEPNGNMVMVQDLGPRANTAGEAFGEQIAYDPSDKHVYAQGMFKGTLETTIAGVPVRIQNRTTLWQPFTAIFDEAGNWLDLQPSKVVGKPYTKNTATDKDGCIYETGSFNGTIVKDPGNKLLTSAGLSDGFVTKFCGLPPSSSASQVSFPLAKAKLYSVDPNLRFNMGTTAVGQPKEQTLNTGICNGGNLDTFIDSVSVDNPQFSLKTVLNGRLFPAVNCDTVPIEVLFDPTSPGEHCAKVTFYASCSPVVSMTICGIGVEPCTYTYTSDTVFTNTLVTSKSTMLIKTALCNKSGIIIDGKLKLAGTNPGDYKIVSINPGYGTALPSSGDTTITIRPGQCLELGVEFNPTATGKRSAIIDLGLPADCGAPRIQLSGDGISPLQATVSNGIWACVPVNGKDQKVIKIKNNGGSEATIESITLQKNDGTFTVISPTLPISPYKLGSGQESNLTIEFSPKTATLGLWDSLLVKASADNQTITVGGRLQGDGCTGTLKADSNCVGTTIVGTNNTKADALILNNTGNAPLNVSSITIVGSTEFDNLTPVAPFTIPAGGKQIMSVRFTPQFVGYRSATVNIVHDGPNGSSQATICGEGFSADSTVNFGTILVCETPGAVIPYPNLSSTKVTIDASVEGTDKDQFTLLPSGSVDIGAGLTNNFLIMFTPQRAGTFAATVKLGQRKINLIGKAITSGMKVYTSPNDYQKVVPGKAVNLIVKAKIDSAIGTTNVDTLQVILSYNAQNLEYSNKLISKINGWTWNAVSKPNNIVVSGKGITSIPGKSDVELFELEYNAYLGDTNVFSVDVQATTSTSLSKCLIINTAGSSLTLDKICFQNGRFIRGSGIGYALKQIGQSPAVDQASIEYSIGISGQTTIELYNSMGQKVHTLLNGTLQSGSYELSLSTESLPSGMYICVMKSGPFQAQQQLMITK